MISMNQDGKQKYTAEDIYVLEGLEPVRRRPGMYIGSTGKRGLHHLIWEVVDNAIDEAMAGFCDEIILRLFDGNRVSVSDNGRGIPVDIHKQTKKSALETVMTTLHAGGKFGGESYKVAGGLHGVGVSVVCALSSYMEAQVCREGKKYIQKYCRGKATTRVIESGECRRRGTTIIFEPDPDIFWNGRIPAEPQFSLKRIIEHLRQQAYLTSALKIVIFDERKSRGQDKEFPPKYTFYFEGGLVAYVRHLNRAQDDFSSIFWVKKRERDIDCEVAFQYTDSLQSIIQSFANNIFTADGGTHLAGFKTALTKTLNKYALESDILKKGKETLSGEDVQEGLTAVVSVKLKEPQFEGQTKTRLGNREVRGAVEKIVSEAFYKFLKTNSPQANKIIQKALLVQKARKKSKALRDTILRKGVLSGLTLPGKLTDCAVSDPRQAEIFIVEGDSAGGSAKQARNPEFQAILPLRGKILNVEKARINKILASQEIKALIMALGTAIAEEFDLSKLRYHKIIITVDADIDGSHIETLLLTLFFRYFRPVIEQGFLFIAQPPLYRIQKGKSVFYAYSDEEKDVLLERISSEDEKKITIQRYKGLGEMNPQQLWETTMNPARRILKKVMIRDAQEADWTFDTLMGVEVLPRKKFIQTHATQVSNLDI